MIQKAAKKKSTVRHTRSNRVARSKKPPTPPPDEQTAQRLARIIHPATLAQMDYYRQLGLRERILTLPLMVALVLSLIWRQFASVSEALRVLETEGLLWSAPLKVAQQSLSQRLRVLPAELFERLLHEVLPTMQAHWQQRTRPLPPELQQALQHYSAVLAVDGSTLDGLLRQVGLLREAPEAPLAGRMTALLDVASRLPRQVWYSADATAHDQRWWPQIVQQVPAGALLLFDLGYTNYAYFADLVRQQVTFITRAKSNAAFQVTEVLFQSDRVRDYLISLGAECLPLRLIELYYEGKWYRYFTSERDPQRLPPAYVVALYWQRWRIEDAYHTIKRLLGLAYFWVGSHNGVRLQLWATWLLYAVLVDLTDELADTLGVPFNDLSLEMVYRSLYFATTASHRGESDDPIAYLAANAALFGLIKRKRKPSALHLLNLTARGDP